MSFVLRAGWFILACLVYVTVSDYVAQQRFSVLGFCPMSTSRGPSVMVFDSRDLGVGCLPLPAPDPGVIEHPLVPNPKQGV